MSKRISVVLCLLLVVAMAFSIIGCSSAPADSSADSSSSASDSSKPSESQEGRSEPITLDFWDMAWGPAEKYPPTAEAIAHRYTEEVDPNVTINYTNLPWANCFETYSTAVASNSAPDVGIGGGFMPFQFAVNDEDADLQWIIDEWKKEGTDGDFLEGMLDYYVYHGKVVGIPFNYDPRVMYIRNDWLQEKGLKMPETYDDFINVGKAFTDKDKEIYGLVVGVTTDSSGPFMSMATGNGGMLYTKDGKANINSERNLQVMKLFRTMKDEGAMPPGVENYSGDDAIKLFNAGKAGMVIKAVANYKNAVTSDGFTTEQVKVIPPLKSPSGVQKEQICVNGYMIFQQSEDVQTATKFLKWFSENSSDLWDSDKGAQDGFPARLSFMNGMDEFKKEFRQEAIEKSLKNSVTLCYPMISGAPSAALAEGEKYDMIIMQAALTMDEAGMKKTLDDLNTAFQKIIDEQD